MSAQRRLLVVDVAALGWELLERNARTRLDGLRFQPADTVFPALTCPVQAAFRTAAPPSANGVWANGFFDRRLCQTFFWEQSAALVRGARIWDDHRAAGGRTALLFWQQSLGESVDRLLSPRPVHRHHGGIISACQSRPAAWADELERQLGVFPLARYWGPLAGAGSSEWIVRATLAALDAGADAPELIFTYLPHLDYDLQRFGPAHPAARRALDRVFGWLGRLHRAAKERGYEVLFFGDYAIAAVTGLPVFINRDLRAAGLFRTRTVKGRTYPNFFDSAVVAVCDHEIALLYARDGTAATAVRTALESGKGVAEIIPVARRAGEDGPDFLAVAEEGRWFAYPWWETTREAPDYAAHVDIHNKPGYDPGELFWGFPPPRVSLSPARVRGTHGRPGARRRVAWASTAPLRPEGDDLLALARALRCWLGNALQ